MKSKHIRVTVENPAVTPRAPRAQRLLQVHPERVVLSLRVLQTLLVRHNQPLKLHHLVPSRLVLLLPRVLDRHRALQDDVFARQRVWVASGFGARPVSRARAAAIGTPAARASHGPPDGRLERLKDALRARVRIRDVARGAHLAYERGDPLLTQSRRRGAFQPRRSRRSLRRRARRRLRRAQRRARVSLSD